MGPIRRVLRHRSAGSRSGSGIQEPAGWPTSPLPRDVGSAARAAHDAAAQRNQLDARLAEYNSLRQESLQAITNRIQVMNFAFTSLSVVLAAILTSNVSRVILILIGLVFVPMASKASALIWLGEYNRSQRAGRGISYLEQKINELLEGPHLSWEAGLITTSTHMGYPYIATVLFLLSTGAFGEFLGAFYLVTSLAKFNDTYAWISAGGVLLYVVILECAFIRFFRKRWIAIRTYSHSG